MFDVNNLIKADRACDDALPTIKARLDAGICSKVNLAQALRSVFQAVFEHPDWEKVLDIRFHGREHCMRTITENVRLSEEVIKGLRTDDWGSLFHNQEFLWNPDEVFNAIATADLDPITVENLKYVRAAFEDAYKSDSPADFLNYIDMYAPMPGIMNNYYNRSLSIVQSSGMGKSRLVDECAKKRFTIPFNLREPLPENIHAYPPPDDKVRVYLRREYTRNKQGLALHYSFFEALFLMVCTALNDYKKEDAHQLPSLWYERLKEHSSESKVGSYRAKLYEQVVSRAMKLQEIVPENAFTKDKLEELIEDDILHARQANMVNAARDLVTRMKELCGEMNNKFSVIIYFDEAHTLQDAKINSEKCPSALFSCQQKPSFTHLLRRISSAHLFMFKGTTRIAMETNMLTLSRVCELKHLTKFGRPLWRSQYLNLPEGKKAELLTLAMAKLGPKQFNDESKTPNFARLAALDIRVLLDYEHNTPNTRSTHTELVKNYMQCVRYIPEHHKFIDSGYASEPMLAEAAARLLNQGPHKTIMSYAPRILIEALKGGLITQGERGQLIARVLLTIAHDRAILENPTFYPLISTEPDFHRPIRLVDLLQSLLAKEVWQIVRDALPVHAYPDSEPLHTAFENAWVNFSHFVRLEDIASFNLDTATLCIEHGMAMQVHNTTPNQDIGIPLLVDDRDAQITRAKMSIAQFQIKNSAAHDREVPDPKLAGDVYGELPILSIVMELGVKEPLLQKRPGHGQPVVITTHEADTIFTRSVDNASASDINRRHYIISLYGCTMQTYSCIPMDMARIYHRLLKVKNSKPSFITDRPDLMLYKTCGQLDSDDDQR